MKKYIIISALALFFATGLQAQVGVGARGIFGIDGHSYGGAEFSIQKLGDYELDLGAINESWKVTGLKLFPFVERRNLGLYGGLGLGVGYYAPTGEVFGNFAADLGGYIMIGRLQLGLDWRPEWVFVNSYDSDLSLNTSLAARWVFGK